MICIKNGTIHTAVDPQPFTGDILIGGGKILKIASHIDDDYEQLIEAAGLNIYPGFVEAHCHTGLDGYGNGVPGQDTNEWNDPVVPQLRAIDGINPMDPCFEMAAKAGITCFATGPGSSDAIGGTFAAVKPMGKRIDNMILKYPIAMKCAFGENPKRRYMTSRMSTRMTNAALIREALMKARNYHTSWKLAETDPSKKPPKFDMKLHSLMRVFDGMPVKITAKRSYDMATAIRIAEEFGLHYTLEDCTESWLIPDLLKKHNVSCVVGPSYGSRSNENRNRDPIVGSVLEEHGIPFAASTAHPKMNIELAAIHLTLMYKKGLTSLTALESATINAARVCGLDQRVGSLEPGKDADIVIWDGYPLDYYSSASTVLIEGKVVYQK